MPQLDPNSFHYQYFGIIILMCSVYVLFSFMTLPLLLRVLLIRTYFIKLTNTQTLFVNFINIKKNLASIKSSSFNTLNNINTFIYNLSSAILITVQLKNVLSSKTLASSINNVATLFKNTYYTAYLNFLFVLDNNN